MREQNLIARSSAVPELYAVALESIGVEGNRVDDVRLVLMIEAKDTEYILHRQGTSRMKCQQ